MENKTRVRLEFIVLMTFIMSISALSSNALLPALGIIGQTFHVTSTSDKQLLVTMAMLGIGVGQMFSGALSDSFGRKPVMCAGLAIFCVASVLSIFAQSYKILVLSRLLQGFGLSAPRTVSLAIIRDAYTGNAMAKVMSFIAMTFFFVPAFAPSIGDFLLHRTSSGWYSIFYMQIIIAIVGLVWFMIRQSETLEVNKRAHFDYHIFTRSLKIFFQEKDAVIYTIVLGVEAGAFITYMSAGEAILIGQYHKVAEFPYLFPTAAIAMGISMFINGRLVMKVGMVKLIRVASLFFTLIPCLYILLFSDGINPPIGIFIAFLMAQFFSIGFIAGNLQSLIMQPLGAIAGMASALFGFFSTLISVYYAGVVGSYIDTSALPLFIGFLVSGIVMNILIRLTKK